MIGSGYDGKYIDCYDKATGEKCPLSIWNDEELYDTSVRKLIDNNDGKC